MSSNVTEDILMTFVNDLEGEEWADNFLFDPASSSQLAHGTSTRYSETCTCHKQSGRNIHAMAFSSVLMNVCRCP